MRRIASAMPPCIWSLIAIFSLLAIYSPSIYHPRRW
jgi:hypothetical protein